MTRQCCGYLLCFLAFITVTSAAHPHSTKPQCAPGAKIPGIICGAGLTRLKCPLGFQCLIDPAIQLGFCCRQDSEQPPPQETGPASLTTPEPEYDIPAGQGHNSNQGQQNSSSAQLPEGVVGWTGTTQSPQGAPEISDMLDPERDGAPQPPAPKGKAGTSKTTKHAKTPKQTKLSVTPVINNNQTASNKPKVQLDIPDHLDPDRDVIPNTTRAKPSQGSPSTTRKVKKLPKPQPKVQKKTPTNALPKQNKGSSNVPKRKIDPVDALDPERDPTLSKKRTVPKPAKAGSTKQVQESTGSQVVSKVPKTTQTGTVGKDKPVLSRDFKQSAHIAKIAKPRQTSGVSSPTGTSIQVPCENPVRDGNGKFTMCSRRSACSSPCQFCGQLRNFQIPIGICCQSNIAACSRSSTGWTLILNDPIGGVESLRNTVPHQLIGGNSARPQMSPNRLGAPKSSRIGTIRASGEIRLPSFNAITSRNIGSMSLVSRDNGGLLPVTSINSQNRNGQQSSLRRYPYPQSIAEHARQDPTSDFSYPMMLLML